MTPGIKILSSGSRVSCHTVHSCACRGLAASTTNFVEHPRLIAQRILRFADIVRRERVIAGSDCGFGTFAGYGKLDPDISFKKLRAMAEGAAIASKRLWGRA